MVAGAQATPSGRKVLGNPKVDKSNRLQHPGPIDPALQALSHGSSKLDL